MSAAASAASAASPAVSAPCTRWRERPYREQLQLRDGRRVLLRPAHHGDAEAMQRFFAESLSPRSRLLRFHGAVNRLPEATLRAMTTQQPGRHVALVALADTDDGLRRLLAEARYVAEDDGRAEFAVAVADAWQAQGLGRALLTRLAAHARAEGLHLLHGSVVPGNEPMLALAARIGATLAGDASELSVRVAL